MRYLIVLLLAGCASSRDFEAGKYEPDCARQCLAINAQCVGMAKPFNIGMCGDNTQQCFATCPRK